MKLYNYYEQTIVHPNYNTLFTQFYVLRAVVLNGLPLGAHKLTILQLYQEVRLTLVFTQMYDYQIRFIQSSAVFHNSLWNLLYIMVVLSLTNLFL